MRTTRHLAATLLAASLVLAGCNGDDTDGDDGVTTSDAAGTADADAGGTADGDVVGTVTDVAEGDDGLTVTVDVDGDTQDLDVAPGALVTTRSEGGGNQRVPLRVLLDGDGFGDGTWAFTERGGRITDIEQAD